MPSYAYSCEECNAHFSVRKSISQRDEQTLCPKCGAASTHRLISTVAVFSSSADGQRRAIAGAPSCGGCGMAATGCSSCGSH